MKKSEIMAVFLSILVILPIWLFLLYNILSYIQPDRLVWFLYYMYVPLTFLSGILSGIVAKIEGE